MNTNGFRPCSLLTALLLALTPALAQQAQSPDVSGAAAVAPAAKTFSQQELDQLMAPIALYPDDVNVVFVAATGSPWGLGGARGLYKATSERTG